MKAKREPFCWIEKPKLKMLGDILAEDNLDCSLASVRSVYLALAEIASDQQSDTFIVATSYIAQRAGVTPKTVRRVTLILKQAGFLAINTRSDNGLKLPSEYTIIRGRIPIGLNYPSLGK